MKTRRKTPTKKQRHFHAEHTDVEPHMRTSAEREELFPLLDSLANKMCMSMPFIIGALRDAGLTVVPLNHHAREIAPDRVRP